MANCPFIDPRAALLVQVSACGIAYPRSSRTLDRISSTLRKNAP